MENNQTENFFRERRFSTRYETKNVLIYIRLLKKVNLVNRFSGPFVIDDIAISSVRFKCPREYLVNSLIELKMELANHDLIIFIKGKIKGKKSDLFENLIEYIVQFSPYGKGFEYNTTESKELLEYFLGNIQADENGGE